MTRNQRRMCAGGAIVLGVVIASGVWLYRVTRPREFELKSATISRLELQRQGEQVVAARGEITFVHPKSGKAMQITGTVPADCPIQIGAVPARLEDLCVGDRVAVRALVSADRSMKPLWIRVLDRPQEARAASQPGGPS